LVRFSGHLHTRDRLPDRIIAGGGKGRAFEEAGSAGLLFLMHYSAALDFDLDVGYGRRESVLFEQERGGEARWTNPGLTPLREGSRRRTRGEEWRRRFLPRR
jgi:hypothetical protein